MMLCMVIRAPVQCRVESYVKRSANDQMLKYGSITTRGNGRRTERGWRCGLPRCKQGSNNKRQAHQCGFQHFKPTRTHRVLYVFYPAVGALSKMCAQAWFRRHFDPANLGIGCFRNPPCGIIPRRLSGTASARCQHHLFSRMWARPFRPGSSIG